MINKRVLVISNNCFSNTTSNGRTLQSFFSAEDNDKIAQFYIQKEIPNFEICKNYFSVTDKDVAKGVLKLKCVGNVVGKTSTEKNVSYGDKTAKKIKRTPFTMLLRTFFWNRKVWRGEFLKWVDEFSPECVLLQAGDAPFMFNLALNLAKRHDVPLVIYNSEDYYFKNYNYFRNSGFSSLLYPIFRCKLKKSIKKAIEYSSKCIYATEELKNLYDEKFGTNSEYIYTGSEITAKSKQKNEQVFSYLGNLGLNRHEGLIEIANALSSINGSFRLDVYGKTPNFEVEKAFENCEALVFHGMVDYETVKSVIEKSMLLFHTESFDEFYVRDVCHGFTTKIADSLSSGTCFVVYAPANLTCTRYLDASNSACVITDQVELVPNLKKLIESKELRDKYIENAIRLANKNHNFEKNKIKFSTIINSLRIK